jgi:hypothetical protein
MVDFFRDMSHGQLDVSESQVFDWTTLAYGRSVWAGNVATPPPGKYNRGSLFALCQQTALEQHPEYKATQNTFDGTVVSMIGNVDLWGGPPGVMRAFCDDAFDPSTGAKFNLSPSALGQEMGHGYGLDHSRQEDSGDYTDDWDAMSTRTSTMQSNNEWGLIGPGLNAQCMRSRGWLDESRVWRPSSSSFDTLVQLRPRHRPDLPGPLAAELPGGFLVEYRPKERWDAAFDHSAVFVHSFSADNHSYVMRGTRGNFDLAAGDSFQRGPAQLRVLEGYTQMDVVAIDDDARNRDGPPAA